MTRVDECPPSARITRESGIPAAIRSVMRRNIQVRRGARGRFELPCPFGHRILKLPALRTDAASSCRSVSLLVVLCARVSSCCEQDVIKEASCGSIDQELDQARGRTVLPPQDGMPPMNAHACVGEGCSQAD